MNGAAGETPSQQFVPGRSLAAFLCDPPDENPLQALRESSGSWPWRPALTPDFRIEIHWQLFAEAETARVLVLRSLRIPADEDMHHVRISPGGTQAWVRLRSGWFLWPISSGKRPRPVEESGGALVVAPDWRTVVSVSNGVLKLFDLHRGKVIFERLLGTSESRDPRRVEIAPNGRHLLVQDDFGVRVWRLTKEQVAAVVSCPDAEYAAMSPDGNYFACVTGTLVEVFDLSNGQALLQQRCFRRRSDGADYELRFERDSLFLYGEYPSGYDYESEAEQICLKFRNHPMLERGIEPLVTANRLFRYRSDDAELLRLLAVRPKLPDEYEIPGEFDSQLTAICPQCAKRFPVPLAAELAISRLCAELNPHQSPCLHLSDAAWNDPALRMACEHCRSPVQLNPFAVDESTL